MQQYFVAQRTTHDILMDNLMDNRFNDHDVRIYNAHMVNDAVETEARQ